MNATLRAGILYVILVTAPGAEQLITAAAFHLAEQAHRAGTRS